MGSNGLTFFSKQSFLEQAVVDECRRLENAELALTSSHATIKHRLACLLHSLNGGTDDSLPRLPSTETDTRGDRSAPVIQQHRNALKNRTSVRKHASFSTECYSVIL